MSERYVQCISCGHIVGWFEHTQLIAAVDCPTCGAKNQFGPGIYVDDFKGKTLKDCRDYRNQREREGIWDWRTNKPLVLQP